MSVNDHNNLPAPVGTAGTPIGTVEHHDNSSMTVSNHASAQVGHLNLTAGNVNNDTSIFIASAGTDGNTSDFFTPAGTNDNTSDFIASAGTVNNDTSPYTSDNDIFFDAVEHSFFLDALDNEAYFDAVENNTFFDTADSNNTADAAAIDTSLETIDDDTSLHTVDNDTSFLTVNSDTSSTTINSNSTSGFASITTASSTVSSNTSAGITNNLIPNGTTNDIAPSSADTNTNKPAPCTLTKEDREYLRNFTQFPLIALRSALGLKGGPTSEDAQKYFNKVIDAQWPQMVRNVERSGSKRNFGLLPPDADVDLFSAEHRNLQIDKYFSHIDPRPGFAPLNNPLLHAPPPQPCAQPNPFRSFTPAPELPTIDPSVLSDWPSEEEIQASIERLAQEESRLHGEPDDESEHELEDESEGEPEDESENEPEPEQEPEDEQGEDGETDDEYQGDASDSDSDSDSEGLYSEPPPRNRPARAAAAAATTTTTAPRSPSAATAAATAGPVRTGAWTPAEDAAAASAMQWVLDHKGGREGLTLQEKYVEAARRMAAAHGFHRTAAAFKNQWNRRLRGESGVDERRKLKPHRMHTSAQGVGGRSSAAWKAAGAAARAGRDADEALRVERREREGREKAERAAARKRKVVEEEEESEEEEKTKRKKRKIDKGKGKRPREEEEASEEERRRKRQKSREEEKEEEDDDDWVPAVTGAAGEGPSSQRVRSNIRAQVAADAELARRLQAEEDALSHPRRTRRQG